MSDDHAIIQYLRDLTVWWVVVGILNIPFAIRFIYVLYSHHFLVRVTLTLIFIFLASEAHCIFVGAIMGYVRFTQRQRTASLSW